MKLLVRAYMLIIFFVISDVAFSMPVSTVYRADSREPGDVFVKGFSAWGLNMNFNSHILGVSGRRGTRDSAFIPTTSSQNAANRFATDLLNVSSEGLAYVYNIRPVTNFYSALDTIYHIYDSAGVRVPDTLRATLASEQEYSAYQHIPTELIRSVTIYSRAENGSISTRVENNPNYIQSDSHSNENPFTSGEQEPNVRPVLVMGMAMTNINNEMPGTSATLPSPSFSQPALSFLLDHEL